MHDLPVNTSDYICLAENYRAVNKILKSRNLSALKNIDSLQNYVMNSEPIQS